MHFLSISGPMLATGASLQMFWIDTVITFTSGIVIGDNLSIYILHQ